MSHLLGAHAVVIGSGIAGLTTAAALSEHFAAVSIVERDPVEPQTRERRAVPQCHHVHVLLSGGLRALATLFPALPERLNAAGSVQFRVGTEGIIHCAAGAFYNFGCTVVQPFDYGADIQNQSRGLLEQCLRQLVLELANVQLVADATVDAPLGDARQIRGVRILSEGHAAELPADLVVDAGGRGSKTPRWLEELGLRAPPETAIDVDFAYASTRFRIPADYDEPYRLMAFHGPPPRFIKSAALVEIEDRTWLVSAAGRFEQKPPADADGFMRFVATLPTPKLSRLLRHAERVADIRAYRFPRSLRRHYERLRAFPKGFLVIGDALCSVNPVYGQGMSTAALEAQALGGLLARRAAEGRGLEGLADEFFPVAAALIDTPWSLAEVADFQFSQTTGSRPRLMKLRTRYMDALNALAARDPSVNQLMTEVFHLAKPVAALRGGAVLSRVLADSARGLVKSRHSGG